MPNYFARTGLFFKKVYHTAKATHAAAKEAHRVASPYYKRAREEIEPRARDAYAAGRRIGGKFRALGRAAARDKTGSKITIKSKGALIKIRGL